MGIKLFSASSYDNRVIEKIVYKTKYKTLSNPDPSNYKIIQYLESNNYLIVEIQYPDCTNYEGKKILLYKNCTMKKLLKQKSIDPHFSDNKKFHSPIARFEPTTEGWVNAKIIVQNYKYK